MVIVVGCSHPGIDKIVEAAGAINPQIHLIVGGFHLVVLKKAFGDHYLYGGLGSTLALSTAAH
jgi:7,8-dihydropterin-6-yl-methyl-4-(beta-D-ribofuranosyl)aminobenzene 5'-phosphate synthase